MRNNSVAVVEKPVVVIAHRTAVHGKDVDQYLCLSTGGLSRFRMFTADSGELRETMDDVAAVEFDAAADVRVNLFLIESFWRIQVDIAKVERYIERGSVCLGERYGERTDVHVQGR
jgi:hypothetical protein